MANMTKAQLVDENIRLRAQCDVLESKLRMRESLIRDLNEQIGALNQAYDRLAAVKPSAQAVPAWKTAAEHRRTLSRAYFKAHPGARSVTDEQLRDFEESFA